MRLTNIIRALLVGVALAPTAVAGDKEVVVKLERVEVAYLVYHKDGRTLSLFVTDCTKMKFPAKDGGKAVMESSRGYRAACWRKGEIGYILVSDLPAEDLETLAERARVAG